MSTFLMWLGIYEVFSVGFVAGRLFDDDFRACWECPDEKGTAVLLAPFILACTIIIFIAYKILKVQNWRFGNDRGI